jgi:hypothetical protein
MKLSKAIRDLFIQQPFGEVWPPRAEPPPQTVDGRTVALRIMKKYIGELTFFRPGGKDQNGVAGPPVAFKVLPENIHIEWPDDPVEMVFPSIVFLSQGPAQYAAIGLTTNLDEDSVNKFAPGTVVQIQSEFTETFAIEIWADTKPQRRSLLAGLETSLTPTETMYGIRFRMPDYYDQLVCFSLGSRMLTDDEFATKNRRKAQLMIEMRFNTVALVNVNTIDPSVKVSVDVDLDSGEPVTLDDEET